MAEDNILSKDKIEEMIREAFDDGKHEIFVYENQVIVKKKGVDI